jgi:hypothetical protein
LSIEAGLVSGETSANLSGWREAMEKIWDWIRQWLKRMNAPDACVEIIECMSPRERADLPSFHPRQDRPPPGDAQGC